MKKFIVLIAISLYSISSAQAQNQFSKVILPQLPQTLAFAGEKVPLDNFDTRESLEREIMVTAYMHSRTTQTLLNAKRYFAVIEPIMAKYGIPEDFKYLCMAESGLNPNAVSSAKAGGLWQIMPATGKEQGLEVGTQIDERFHLEKSTEAACKILAASYKRFGSWTLAAAAYNIGNAGVSRRIEKQGVTDYYDAFFPEETMRYIFRILSFKLICEDPFGYGFVIMKGDYHKPLTDYTEVTVSKTKLDWSALARDHGTNYKMLRELNPWIRDYDLDNKAGKKYVVKIPGRNFRTSAER